MKTSQKIEKFTHWINNTLRDYQQSAFSETLKNNKGQFFLPTGTGKTYIQKAIHANNILTKENNNQRCICIITAHRLLLCRQLLNELTEFLKYLNIEHETIFVGGGGDCDLTGSLDEIYIKNKVDEAIKNKRHVVIASTYQSFNKLSILKNIDVCTFDEAHNIVAPSTSKQQFKTNIESVKIIKKYYFTATPKNILEDFGQKNLSFFGKVLYHMSPKEAVEKKLIVPPALIIGKIHDINEKDLQCNNTYVTVKTIIDSFSYQKKKSILAPKILIAFKNIKNDLLPVYNDVYFKSWCEENNVKRLMFSSGYGHWINDKEYKNINDILPEVDTIKKNSDENCVFLYHDILSEGIDIPNMTGILMFRDLEDNNLRFTQNIGRCCRIDTNKEFSYISVPDYLLKTEKYTEMIKAIYNSYEIKYSDVKIFITTQTGEIKEYERNSSDIISKEIEGLDFYYEIKTFLDLFNFNKVIQDLNNDFENSDDKEQFLLDLINETYNKELLYIEGLKSRIEEYEYFTRDPEARAKCLKKWGYNCFVCGKNMEKIYGENGKNIIEVHHEKQICEGYRVTDPINDLKPVCPDCHTIIHTRIPMYKIEEVSEMIGIIELTDIVKTKGI